jgi:basic membrane protein A and related proteins
VCIRTLKLDKISLKATVFVAIQNMKKENPLRRIIKIASVLFAGALVLAACSSSDDSTGGVESDVKVGLAYDSGGRGDGTFNDAAAGGVDRAKSEFGVDVNEVEASDSDGTPERAERLRLLAADGYNPVIAVGFAYSDALAEVAPEFPETTFAIVDSVVDSPNVASLIFAAEQGSFLVGTIAATASKSGKVGFIGGMEIDLIRAFQAGYEQGAKAVNPDIEIQVAYMGPAGDNSAWNAPDRAKIATEGMIDSGVDIVYAAAGGSGLGMHQAIAAAGGSAAGYWGIGVDSDEYVLPARAEFKDNIITSMLKRVDVAVFEVIKSVVDGAPLSGIQNFDLSREGVGYSSSNPAVATLAGVADEYANKIIDGEIVVSSTLD